jgi:hypothetical protein
MHQMLMNLLAVSTGSMLPTRYGSFIYTKRGNNRLKWTPISQERDNLRDNLTRISKAVEHSPFALSKCPLALMTDVTLVLATMNTYISPTHFSPCRAGGIVTEYLLGIHVLTPLLLGYIKIVSGSPTCQDINPHFTGVLPLMNQ